MPAVTSQVPGDGANTLSFTIPGNGLEVQTVYAVIDATAAGGPVTAELQIADQSGVIIAAKPQSETVDAGAPGSATWALRLDDSGGPGGGNVLTPQTEVFTPKLYTVNAGATKNYEFFHDSGETLYTGGGSTAPSPLATGSYLWVVVAQAVSSTAFNAGRAYWIDALFFGGGGGFQEGFASSYPGAQVNPSRISVTVGGISTPSGSIQFGVVNNDSIAHNLTLSAYVSRMD